MKKTLFLISIILIVSFSQVFSQPCVPGNYPGHGIFPDSLTGLPAAYVNQNYSTVMTIIVPTDTIIDVGAGPSYAVIDSVGLIDIAGLPPGLTYSTNPLNGFIHSDSAGCVLIEGTVPPGYVGFYPITLKLEAWADSYHQPTYLYVSDYTIEVKDTITITAKLQNSKTIKAFNYPNPFSQNTEIIFDTDFKDEASLVIYNSAGMLLHTSSVKIQKGKNTIPLHLEAPAGYYVYRITGNRLNIQSSFVIK